MYTEFNCIQCFSNWLVPSSVNGAYRVCVHLILHCPTLQYAQYFRKLKCLTVQLHEGDCTMCMFGELSTDICPLLFCSSAVCNQPCLNGGTCSQPDTCTCVTGWNGTTCNEGLWNFQDVLTYAHIHKEQSPKETLPVTVHHSAAPQPLTLSF